MISSLSTDETSTAATSRRAVSGVRRLCGLALVLTPLMLPLKGNAGIARTQTLQLQKGWNAVFLEVYPPDSEPAVVFADTPVDVAASYYSPGSSAQFMTDPGVNLFRRAGWGVWYAADRPDAFLKSLHTVYGQQAYLIHATSAFTWSVTGDVVPAEVRWKPDSFNLVGFSVNAQAPPTFAQFFAGSTAHQHNRIYRLTNGSWRQVLNPAAETMASGEAYWIYAEGASTYQGPLRAQTRLAQGLYLGSGSDAIVLRNEADHPVTPTVEHVVYGTNAIPLAILIQATGDREVPVRTISAPLPDGAWTQPLPPIEVGGVIQIALEARTEGVHDFVQSTLLKVWTDVGTETWIPAVSVRNDKEAQ